MATHCCQKREATFSSRTTAPSTFGTTTAISSIPRTVQPARRRSRSRPCAPETSPTRSPTRVCGTGRAAACSCGSIHARRMTAQVSRTATASRRARAHLWEQSPSVHAGAGVVGVNTANDDNKGGSRAAAMAVIDASAPNSNTAQPTPGPLEPTRLPRRILELARRAEQLQRSVRRQQRVARRMGISTDRAKTLISLGKAVRKLGTCAPRTAAEGLFSRATAVSGGSGRHWGRYAARMSTTWTVPVVRGGGGRH